LSRWCSGDEETTVDVTVQEFAVIPAESSAPAGDVTFDVTNEGPDDVHEFVVFKTDLAPDALPTVADGSVDEEGEGVELIDEIEDITIGDTPTLTSRWTPAATCSSANSSRRKAERRSRTTSRGCGSPSPSSNATAVVRDA
jgi:hypothetical protein